jgi:DNA-binding LytR/AlgR family response regulator
MQIEIKIDSSYTDPKVIILTDKMTDEVNAIVKYLSDDSPQMLAGFRENMLEILDQQYILRIYAAAGKIIATTGEGEYALRLRLYELEDRLDKNSFVRISNSEIINLKKVKNFDLSFAGTICVTFSGGLVTYVSRRYVAKIKQVL